MASKISSICKKEVKKNPTEEFWHHIDPGNKVLEKQQILFKIVKEHKHKMTNLHKPVSETRHFRLWNRIGIQKYLLLILLAYKITKLALKEVPIVVWNNMKGRWLNSSVFETSNESSNVTDPWHFGVDPDPDAALLVIDANKKII